MAIRRTASLHDLALWDDLNVLSPVNDDGQQLTHM